MFLLDIRMLSILHLEEIVRAVFITVECTAATPYFRRAEITSGFETGFVLYTPVAHVHVSKCCIFEW